MRRSTIGAAVLAVAGLLPLPALRAGDGEPTCGVEKVKFPLTDELLRRAGIEWTRAGRHAFPESVVLAAELVHPEDRLVRVRPRAAGTVLEARKTIGDPVAAGDVLAVIESAEVADARGAFVGTSADLRAARATLASERETATKALGALERAVAEGRPLAEDALRRQRDLAKQGLSSEKERLEAERSFLSETLGAERELALATLETRRRLAEAEAAERKAAAALRAAAARLAALGFSPEERRALEAEDAPFDGRLEVRSPLAGTVVARAATVGEGAVPDATLFEVADATTLLAVARVPERDLARLAAGQAALLQVPAHPGRQFKGRVLHVGEVLDPHSRAAAVRIAVGNRRGLLRAGMLGRVAVTVRPAETAVAVPSDAVQTDGCCMLVFVRGREGQVRVRRIRPGAEEGGFTEVVEGLADGEEVIGKGAFTLKAEMLRSKFGGGCCESD